MAGGMNAKILIAGILLLFLTFPVYADTIIIASDNWCPFNCIPDSDNEGFMVDIARAVFKKAGHTVEYRNIPWSRTLKEVRKGKIHGAIGPYTDDCPDFIFPENELAKIGFEIFVKNETTWKYNGIRSLKHIRIGVISDYSYGKTLDEFIKLNKYNTDNVQIVYGNEPLKKNILKLS